MERRKRRRNNKDIILIIIALIVDFIVVYLLFYYGYMKRTVSSYEDKIYPQIFIEDIEIVGKTRSEVANLLNEKTEELINNDINAKAKDKEVRNVTLTKENGKLRVSERSVKEKKDRNIINILHT